jgi:dipeptidyl aminopeptidase/acylaminoacyl peptidase
MKKQINLILLFLSISIFAFSQEGKKVLNHQDILKWNRITEKMISNDGQSIVYKLQPWKGDPTLKIANSKAEELFSIRGGSQAKITANSKFVVFKINPAEEEIHALKVKKTKKADFPLPQLAIYSLLDKKLEKVEKLKTYKMPSKGLAFVAYQVEAKKDSTQKSTSKKTSLNLHLRNLNSNSEKEFPQVSSYLFSKNGNALVFQSKGDTAQFKAGIYQLNLETGQLQRIFSGKADIKQLSINKDGNRIAFLADSSSKKNSDKNYELYSWSSGQEMAEKLIDKNNAVLPGNWEISPNGKLSFAPETHRLFFGIAPIRAKRDSSILDEDFPKLDIWHWKEDVFHTQQLNRVKRDLKKSYLCVYNPGQRKAFQIEYQDFTGIQLIKKGDYNQALAWSEKPYARQIMYEGYPTHKDFYLVDLKTGNRTQFVKDCRATPQPSPDGKYVFWYNPIDTTWNTYNLKQNKKFVITTPRNLKIANELNDIPNPPRSYNTAAWFKNDEALLVYDRYDIWKVDPENKTKPIKLTKNGRSTKTSYRLIRFDLEGNAREQYSQAQEKGIEPKGVVYLFGHNEITRKDGFYKTSFKSAQNPKLLRQGNFKLNTPIKAKDADRSLFTQENFETYPNILVSDLNFKKTKQISHANPQQKDFVWGSAELVSWTSLDGRKLEGTLHKPANFDPKKKYPMIVNFYEKSSQGLLSYRMPEPHRSTIDYHYYTSNGYLVFNPDVYYKTGYPGEDAFNCVMPGITALIEKGFVDEKHIGAQGHSWGGYQVAYLATRTKLFAAIESGAPVVNMFSAYGGIRWGSGMNRSFQYEHTQSRIGKNIWEAPLRYLENSPLFTTDKVNTPILIMANDDDGAVPWYQGIEYFVALRRLNKPAWLLCYNEADHWPLLIRDKNDFQIRLAQFFAHYLKGEAEPKWMKDGIPAVDKDVDLGYDLEK